MVGGAQPAGDGEAVEPVVGAGVDAEVARLGQDVEHLGEGQRHHRQIDPLDAQRQNAEHQALHQGYDDNRQQGHAERPVEVAADEDGDRIAARAEEHGVAERQDAGVAQQQVVAHGEDGEDEDLDDHPLPELGRAGLGLLHEPAQTGSLGRAAADEQPGQQRKGQQQAQAQQVGPPLARPTANGGALAGWLGGKCFVHNKLRKGIGD